MTIRLINKGFLLVVFMLALCVPGTCLAIQDEPGATAEAPYEFVSGTVVDLSGGKIVVNRALPGKPAENHTFTITGETKIEGNLRVQARVTVGYKAAADSGELVAVRIIVRAQGRK